MVKVRSHAKINLLLNIVGISNNMHLIDGVFVPFNLYDTISVCGRDDENIVLSYTDPKLRFDNDNAIRAARAIQSQYGTKGVNIVIDKQIPVMSGLGGSSADAAAVVKGMQELYALGEIDTQLLLSLGSDVPYMFAGGNKRVSLLGEEIGDVSLPTMYKVALLPGSGVDTALCYKLYDFVGGDSSNIDDFLGAPKQTIKFANALQRAACIINKEITEALSLLERAGFCYGMSGSGSACFGVAYERDDFEKKLSELIRLNDNKFVVIQEEKE